MIRGMERGLEVFLDDTYQVFVDEIRSNLDPRTNGTTRATFNLLVALLEFRMRRYAMRSLEGSQPKEADQFYFRALNELKDEISLWLETPQENINA
jgi:hypothetical protein